MRLVEHPAIRCLIDTLRNIPGVEEYPNAPLSGNVLALTQKGLDAVIGATIGIRNLVFLAKARNAVYPRDVYQIGIQLKNLREAAAAEYPNAFVIPVVAANTVSGGAQEILKQQKIAFCDGGGSLYVADEGIFIDIARPPAPSEARKLKTLFSGTRARIILALLHRPDDWFSIKEMTQTAHVSAGTASEVVKALEDLAWIRSEGRGPNKLRKVEQASAILDAWSGEVLAARVKKPRRYYISYFDNSNFIAHIAFQLNRHGVPYAVTAEAAAQHYAPYMTHIPQVRIRLVHSQRFEAALKDMGARAVDEGANLAAIEVLSDDDLLFREDVQGIWYANVIHAYLDLLKTEGRARDFAKHLRRERIGF